MAKLIIGLGNMGKEYESTIHNMGFEVVKGLLEDYGAKSLKKMCDSMVAELNVSGEKVYLAMPTTYMNNSGIAAKSLVKKFNIDMNREMIIISDDIDLERGKIRVRKSGSAGTHNGLKSIIAHLGTNEFARIRVGVSRPPEHMDLADYVLSKVRDKDIDIGIKKAKEALKMFIEKCDLEAVMQSFN